MVVKNAQEDILVAPEYSLLEFGDGYIAMIQGGIERDDNGRKVVDFIIKPSNLLRKRYGIPDERLNKNGQMNFRVLKDDLLPLNQFDDANRKWMYIKTFNHQDTVISNISWDLRKQLEEERKRIYVMEGELLWAYEQLQLAKTNPQEFAAQGIELMDKLINSSLSSLINKKKDDDGVLG